MKLSIVLPAKNEKVSLKELLPNLKVAYPSAEIIVVDDGSIDQTGEVCFENSIKCIRHIYSKGNGAAIKAGARAATGDVIVFMDADGQHQPAAIEKLLIAIDEGYDMVVGARNGASQANMGRFAANTFYNWIASLMVGHKIKDLTSGFRAVDRKKFLKFLHLLPNGFSYPTTTTMAFFRSGYSVCYVDIDVQKRIGKSHINLSKDGIKFLLIIFKIATLYSPLKLFLPISFSLFSTGIGYYLYTYLTSGRFTNMSALLFTSALIIFLMGLVSEQITALMYKDKDE